MYISYMKKSTKALVQNSNMDFEIFNNTDNIDLVLKTKNNIEIIDKKKKELKLLDKEEEKNIKLYYLNLKKEQEEKKLDMLLNTYYTIYTVNKKFVYVDNNDFIRKLYKELNLIDIYLEIRNRLNNHKDLNIKFNKDKKQKKELRFLNMCFENINKPENFINLLVKKEQKQKNTKQKKLKYEN